MQRTWWRSRSVYHSTVYSIRCYLVIRYWVFLTQYLFKQKAIKYIWIELDMICADKSWEKMRILLAMANSCWSLSAFKWDNILYIDMLFNEISITWQLFPKNMRVEFQCHGVIIEMEGTEKKKQEQPCSIHCRAFLEIPNAKPMVH